MELDGSSLRRPQHYGALDIAHCVRSRGQARIVAAEGMNRE